MKKGSEVFVGVDTAKADNAVAVAEADRDGEGRYLGTFDNTLDTQQSRLAGGALRWHQAEERHELARMLKAAQVARLGNDRHRRHELHPTHRLERLDHRRHRPAGHDHDGRAAAAAEHPRLCTLHFTDIRELRQPRSIGTGWT
jgi:hypothetical protein